MWVIRSILIVWLMLSFAASAAPQVVVDWSQNGLSTDPNGDRVPDENDPTPIAYTAKARPGLYTHAHDAQWQGAGLYLATVDIELVHFSDTAATLQATLDLQQFTGAIFTVHSATSADLTLNPNFDGLTDMNLLVANQSRAIDDVASITVVLSIQPGTNLGPYSFNMNATATTFSETASDISDNEAIDANGDRNANQPGENDPTTIRLAGRNACDVSGLLFHDLNRNSVYDETNVPDGPFCMILASPMGEPLLGTYVETDGTFSLPDVPNGEYALALGMDIMGTCHTEFDNEWSITLPPGGSRAVTVDEGCWDGGITGLTYGVWDGYRVMGKVYQDVATPAHNGVIDTGEQGVPNIPVSLACDGTACQTATTNSAGEYEFWVRYSDATTVTVSADIIPGQWVLISPAAVDLAAFHSDKVHEVNFGLVPENTFAADSVTVRACAESAQHKHIFTAGSAGTVQFSLSGLVPEHHATLQLDLDCDGVAAPAEQDPDLSVLMDRDPSTPAPMKVCTVTTVSLQLCDNLADSVLQVKAAFDYSNINWQREYRARATTQFRDTEEPTVELTKTVANVTKNTNGATAEVCDILEYAIQYRVIGANDLNQLVISDVTAQWTTLWELPPCASTEPCTPSIVTGGVGEAASLRWQFNEPLPPGKQGEVNYRVRVNGGDLCTGSPP